MKVKVTKEDVKKAIEQKGSCTPSLYCPISQCISRSFGKRFRVSFTEFYLLEHVWSGPKYGLPEEAIDFIEKFDHGKISLDNFEEFEIEIPDSFVNFVKGYSNKEVSND